jgi:hypothetical protein
MKLKTIALAAMATIAATVAQAQTGTVGFVDISTPSVSPGPSIAGDAIYNIGNLASFSDTTGIFAGMPTEVFGPVSFQPSNGSSFAISDPSIFGSFQSVSITPVTEGADSTTFYILGIYNGGAWDPTVVNDPASMIVTFSQNPPGTGGISDSAGFSIPPTTVPEPGSVALMGAGASALCLLRRRKA